MDTYKEHFGNKISHEGTISRETFSRSWSSGTPVEQGQMLFDLLGESVILRIRSIEEIQRANTLRVERLEEKLAAHEASSQHKFTTLEKKWSYIAGGIAVVAVFIGPLIAAVIKGLAN